MPPLAGYIRVSHVGGRTAEVFHSPHEQAAEIEAWANAQGQKVEMLPPELDAKGTDASRPVFRSAIDGVRDGRYSGIVVAYLSRAGRDLRLMLDMWDEVEAAGGAVFSARENIDGTTANGRLQRNLLASVAQHELEERRDGFERSTAGAVERGIWQRRQCPLGYRKDEATRRLVPDPKGAKKIRSIFSRYIGGTAISKIARDVGMTPSGIRYLLKNRIYLGELKVRTYVNPEACEPLIDVATFEAAAARLASGVRPGHTGNGPALLAGLARCQSCGHVMTRSISNGVPAYQCRGTHSGERCPETAGIMVKRLNDYVLPIALGELSRLTVTATEGPQVEMAERDLAKAERALDAYLDAVSAEDVGAEAFAKAARKKRDAVLDTQAALHAELERRPAIVATVGTGADVWDGLNDHERNTVLRGLLRAVVVRSAKGDRNAPVADRVRVIAHGADFPLPRRKGGEATGVAPLAFPNEDAVGVLAVPLSENGS